MSGLFFDARTVSLIYWILHAAHSVILQLWIVWWGRKRKNNYINGYETAFYTTSILHRRSPLITQLQCNSLMTAWRNFQRLGLLSTLESWCFETQARHLWVGWYLILYIYFSWVLVREWFMKYWFKTKAISTYCPTCWNKVWALKVSDERWRDFRICFVSEPSSINRNTTWIYLAKRSCMLHISLYPKYVKCFIVQQDVPFDAPQSAAGIPCSTVRVDISSKSLKSAMRFVGLHLH